MKLLGIASKKFLLDEKLSSGIRKVYDSSYLTLYFDGISFRKNETKLSKNFIFDFFVGKSEKTPDLDRTDDDNYFDGSFVDVQIDNVYDIMIQVDINSRIDIYYFANTDLIVFSTDLGLLKNIIVEEFEYDQIALAHSLSIYGGRPPKKSTIYKSIKRLGFQEKLVLSGGNIEVISPIPKLLSVDTDFNESKLRIYADAFLQSLDERASDENLVLFSSGWDSSSVLAGLVRLRGPKKVKCVLGAMKYSNSLIINQFEIDRAKKITEYFGVNLEIIDLDYSQKLPKDFDEICSFMKNENFFNLTSFNHFLLVQAAKVRSDDPSSVIFAGEFSDGLHNLGFAQSAAFFHPNSIEFREYGDKMHSYLFSPSFIDWVSNENISSDPVWKIIRQRTPQLQLDTVGLSDTDKYVQILQSFFLRNSRFPFSSVQNLRLLSTEGRVRYENQLTSDYIKPIKHFVSKTNLYSVYLFLYHSFHWQGGTVQSLESSGKYLDINVTNPYADKRILDFASQIPENFGRGLDLYPTKYPLKWMMKNMFDFPIHLLGGPHSYIYDTDPNFSHSNELLYRSAFSNQFRKVLKGKKLLDILDNELFDTRLIEKIIDRYLNHEGEDSPADLLSICIHSLLLES